MGLILRVTFPCPPWISFLWFSHRSNNQKCSCLSSLFPCSHTSSRSRLHKPGPNPRSDRATGIVHLSPPPNPTTTISPAFFYLRIYHHVWILIRKCGILHYSITCCSSWPLNSRVWVGGRDISNHRLRILFLWCTIIQTYIIPLWVLYRWYVLPTRFVPHVSDQGKYLLW